MDCEKFEASMLDELYGELDELTLAASRRHVSGCARCAALMAGLRATRKIVTLPVLAPSEGFEGRLLSAVQAAEAKPRLTFAQVISWAGGWAMRPQTAMAAVLLLMVGTSSVLLSRKVSRSADGETTFTVTERGAPAAAAAPSPTALTGDQAAVDPRAAAAAHGAAGPAPAASAAPPTLMAKAAPPLENAPSDLPLESQNQLNQAPSSKLAMKPRRAPGGGGAFDETPGSLGALGHGGSAGVGDLKGGADTQFAPPPPPASPAAAAPAKDDSASRLADGDSAGALAAARATRDGPDGCAAAAPQFDQVAAAAPGTTLGYDATYDAANCYARLGQTEAARVRYFKLIMVPAYAARAQQGINASSQVAARSRPSTVKAAVAAPQPSVARPSAPPKAAASEDVPPGAK